MRADDDGGVQSLLGIGGKAIFDDCKRTIQDLTAQEFPDGGDTRRFFARRKRAFCTDIVDEVVFALRIENDESDEVINEEMDDILQVAQEAFGFESISSCEYLGFLLSFRRSLLDDDHYEQRPVLLSSLATIIRLIDEKFLEETCNKVMVVLRAATSVGEGSVAVWTEFVRRLSDGEAFERTAMVLLNSEAGDSSRINFHLRRTCTDDSIERMITAQGKPLGCVRMLLEECDTVGIVVLQKLLSVLNGSPLPDALAAALIPALLHTMRSSGDSFLRVLSAQCLGRLGAVDPGRIGSSSITPGGDQKKIVFVDDAKEVRQHPEKEVFKALKWIVFARDAVFTRHILPQLIIRLILENNEGMINEYCDEMASVLRRVVTNAAGWMRLAAHVVFFVLDTLEQFAIRRMAKKRPNDRRIYTQLQNVDGVLGSYECISACTSPTADERILALEANGDYNEALPLYAQSVNNKELQLIKCLLRLNQPQLALNTAISFYEKESEDKSPQLVSSLASSQLEATWHLRDWSRLEKMVLRSDPLLDRNDSSWGAACASILCAIKRREPLKLTERLLAARQRLVERITAKTIEDSNTYTQAYKYIVDLHILEEIDESKDTLSLLSSRRAARSECVVQCSNILEPILLVRRELLRASADAGAVNRHDVDNALTQLLVQGNQSQAIGLLTKLLTTEFSDMNKLFTNFVQWHEAGAKSSPDSPDMLVKNTGKESRAAFAEKGKEIVHSLIEAEAWKKPQMDFYGYIGCNCQN
ncbi:hypothetical protein NECAME_12523 [Necator americanus]|uniref:PIK-related kinase FAT domain-containing protein n=1 Tax=Necator americanus TaxID=51031 RepID=W2SZA7_NECAM|nr:hypothetical protein NECAME_12523 [Necator americanus]ETN75065.1 hypothetical protein NECAME_12523 [Necator americanus]